MALFAAVTFSLMPVAVVARAAYTLPPLASDDDEDDFPRGWGMPTGAQYLDQLESYACLSEGSCSAGFTHTRLEPNGSLAPGDSLSSPNMTATLVMGVDGNLSIYGPRGADCKKREYRCEPLWQTFTTGLGRGAHMQQDGNFVVYDREGKPVWWTGTSGNPGASLTIEDDWEIVVVAPDGRYLWRSTWSEP
jgi:hypothetical protein